MATVNIDYAPDGDVRLILQQNTVRIPDETATNEPALDSATDAAVETRTEYGSLGFHVQQHSLRVSSSKLIASSEYFEAMLQGRGFAEASKLEEQGNVEIRLQGPEDDPNAIMIILAIMHGHDVETPSRMGLEMLQKVTIMVDKYRWHALVTPYATPWFHKLADSSSSCTAFNAELLSIAWIASVYGFKESFTVLTRVIQQTVPYMIDSSTSQSGLSGKAIDAINLQRTQAFDDIEKVITTFETSLQQVEYSDGESLSTHTAVRCFALGAVRVYWQYLELGDFAPQHTKAHSVHWLVNRISTLPVLTKFTSQVADEKSPRQIAANDLYDLRYALLKAVKSLNIDKWGLDYDDFYTAPSQPETRKRNIEEVN